MLKIRDLLLVAGLVAALAAGIGAYRVIMGPLPSAQVLLQGPGLAIGSGLVLGAATVGYHGRSRLGATVGGAAGAALGGLHAGVAETAGVISPLVMVAGGIASGLAAYLGYRAMLPPAPQTPEGEDEG